MTIENKCIVSIHYTLKNDAGTTIDSSGGKEPLNYLQGAGNIIPGLEKGLAGKSVGDKVEVTVQPEEGYGPVDDEMVQKVPQEAFQGVDKIEPGMQFQANGPDGQTQLITVQAVDDDGVTIDANHPLAGQVLHFDVTIEAIREATEEEVSHGHAH